MKLSLPAKKMLFLIIISAAALTLGGVVLCFALQTLTLADALPITLGILLSSLISAAKVFMLEMQVTKLQTMQEPSKAKLYVFGQSLLRFALTAAGLVAAHFIPFTNLYAAIVGAFTWLIAAYGLKFMDLEEATSNS